MDLIRFVFTLSPRQEGRGICPAPPSRSLTEGSGESEARRDETAVLIQHNWFGVRKRAGRDRREETHSVHEPPESFLTAMQEEF